MKLKYSELSEQEKEKIREYARSYYFKNKERLLAYNKNYRKLNKDKVKERYRKYQNNRTKTDPIFKLRRNLRNRLRMFLKSRNMYKNTSFNEYIGCTPEELKSYIQKKFKLGMNWDNYNLQNWHLDHIKPLSSAKTEEELYKLCHYTNLQPLFVKDHKEKTKKEIFYGKR